jgi:hypothetical protein
LSQWPSRRSASRRRRWTRTGWGGPAAVLGGQVGPGRWLGRPGRPAARWVRVNGTSTWTTISSQ